MKSVSFKILDFIFNIISTGVHSVSLLSGLKSHGVIISLAFLVAPKLSDERPILSLRHLVFPALVKDLLNRLVSDSLRDFPWRSLPE